MSVTTGFLIVQIEIGSRVTGGNNRLGGRPRLLVRAHDVSEAAVVVDGRGEKRRCKTVYAICLREG